jgi:flagellar biogenesis protein FliO
MKRIAILFIVLTYLSVPLFAQKITEKKAPKRLLFKEDKKLSEKEKDMPNIPIFLIWTALVLGLLFLFFYILKRVLRRSGLIFQKGVINILARRRLPNAHEMYLIEVGPRIFFIGASKDRLVTLGEFTDSKQIAIIRAKFSPSEQTRFQATLQEENKLEGIKGLMQEIKKKITSWDLRGERNEP